MGGGDWLLRYIAGDLTVIRTISECFPLLSAYYRLPEHQPALTREDLAEMVGAMFPSKK